MSDFEKEYLSELHNKILASLNAKFKKGFELPLGADLNFGSEKMAVTIHKDFMLA